MNHQHKLPCLQRSFVLQNTLLRNADTVEPGPQSAKTTDDDRAFEFDCEAFDVEADLITFGFGSLIGR